MILETGRIVAVEPDGLWVETIQRSTCTSCRAERGCGQSLMAKMTGHTSYLRILLQGRDSEHYRLGDEVQIGIPENVVAKGSAFAYLVPLLLMLVSAGIAEHLITFEPVTILAAIAGLVAGGLIVRFRAWQTRNNQALQPILIDERDILKLPNEGSYNH